VCSKNVAQRFWFWQYKLFVDTGSLFSRTILKPGSVHSSGASCFDLTECVSFIVLTSFSRVSIACHSERCTNYRQTDRQTDLLYYSKSVCLSVWLSVTRWHWVKMLQSSSFIIII